MGLDRYGVEAGGIASEIEYALESETKAYLGHVRAQNGDEWLLATFREMAEEANKFLAMPPSRQTKKLAKMSNEKAALLLAVVRAQAKLAERAMSYAERMSWIVGRGYRQAAADVAMDTLNANLTVCADDIVPRYWMPAA